jgi:hypothetical protein
VGAYYFADTSLLKEKACFPKAILLTHHLLKTHPKVFPYFKDCIGAIDGAHVDTIASAEDSPRFRNRKGISQNFLRPATLT